MNIDSTNKILFLVQSCIPNVNHVEYFPSLKRTIASIRNQKNIGQNNITIVLSDDGSGYLSEFIDLDKFIQYLPLEKTKLIKEKYSLEVDEIVCVPESEYFMKANLFNFYLKDKGYLYDLIVFLDDDHGFIRSDSLTKFVQHYRNGYDFIVGRLYLQIHGFYDFNFGVQGTTYALSYSALKTLNFFNESVIEWGFGEDIDIFYRAYLLFQKAKISPVFDSNIITVDEISGRWNSCMNNVGGKEIGQKKFKELYGISIEESSVEKNKWMTIIQNDLYFDEKLFRLLNIIDYKMIINGNYIQKKFIVFKIIAKRTILNTRSVFASILRRILGKKYFVKFKYFFGIKDIIVR